MIVLPRRHFLALSGLSEQLFKTLRRRHQLPRLAAEMPVTMTEAERDAYEEEHDARGYLPLDAIMAAVADAFVSTASLDRDTAKAFIQGNPQAIVGAVKLFERGEDVWIAAFTDADLGSDDTIAATPFAMAGDLFDLTKKIHAEWKSEGREGRTLCLLNLTPILRRARRIADELGLGIDSFLLSE